MLSAAQAAAHSTSLTVLLVDDARLNRLIISAQLKRLGLRVVEAEDGQKALAAFCRARQAGRAPDLVVLDLQMPVMNGWETAKRLRRLEARAKWQRTPIVACTALGLQEQWQGYDSVGASALHCGMDDFLEKPLCMQRLLEVLSRHMADLSASLALQPPPQLPPQPPPSSGGSDARQCSSSPPMVAALAS